MADVSTECGAPLRAVIGRLARQLRPTLAGIGLTPTEISVLFSIVRGGPVAIGELAVIEGLNPTMLSRVIGSLCAAGLIDRLQRPEDRRAALVEASAAGRELREQIHRERNEVIGVQLAALSPRELRSIAEALPALEALAERLARRSA